MKSKVEVFTVSDLTGKEYEQLTKEIYEALLKSEGAPVKNVQHNVKVLGRSGCEHQIDVFWEMEFAGIKHRVAVECKDYKNDVSVGRVRDFFGVLHDIGNIQGIVATKVGFQAGAKKFASHYGINLKEIRTPTEADWRGRVKSIQLDLVAVFPSIKSRKPLVDIVWLKSKIGPGQEFRGTLAGFSTDLWVVDAEGRKLKSFWEMDNSLPHDWKAATGCEHTFQFDDGYLELPEFGKLKVTGIQYSYDVESIEETTVTEGEKIVKAIMRDVATGVLHVADHDGNIREVRS